MKLSISYFILATLAKCQVAEAQTCEDNIVVLGDSYSDTGNSISLNQGETPDRYVYTDDDKNIGRFTNGIVWIEYLADLMELNRPNAFYDDAEGTNYANGGAASGDGTLTVWSSVLSGNQMLVANGLLLQTQDVVTNTSSQCASETLFAIWIGAVDLLLLGKTNVQNIVTNIEESITSLIENGAKKIIVLNLPQLADSPGFSTEFPTIYLSQNTPTARVRKSVTEFNTILATMLERIDACNRHVTITHVDIAPLFAEAATNPTKFGLVGDVTKPRFSEKEYFLNNDLIVNPNAANALWFDGVHPTTTFHEAIAEEVNSVLNRKETKSGKNNKAGTITRKVKCSKGAKGPKHSKDTK
eukprot:CAMPEP_0198250034 /NCGR_PEP_ID=MMETSP1447-20131203/1363_1 /TAXON_ID=420782 /ORGANISM="Chaetoceros dichaeta, Strain CCMP1751" /LENGTH=355 /DNA_ID=CAMNT_0043934795 /DNA_START=47 /DNA_END=1114 /DNA_ORIENTATION=+